jgi:hypothetical protein
MEGRSALVRARDFRHVSDRRSSARAGDGGGEEEFPPSQRPATFDMDRVMEQLSKGVH